MFADTLPLCKQAGRPAAGAEGGVVQALGGWQRQHLAPIKLGASPEWVTHLRPCSHCQEKPALHSLTGPTILPASLVLQSHLPQKLYELPQASSRPQFSRQREIVPCFSPIRAHVSLRPEWCPEMEQWSVQLEELGWHASDAHSSPGTG